MNQEQYKKLKDYIVNVLDTPFMEEDAVNISKIFEEDSFTINQIRKAGAEGEINSIDVEHLISILKPNKKQPSQDDDLDYLKKYPVEDKAIDHIIEEQKKWEAALQSLPIKSGADKMIEEIENIQEKESKEICPICGEFKDVCGCWHIKNTPINEVKQPIQDKVSDDELILKIKPLVDDLIRETEENEGVDNNIQSRLYSDELVKISKQYSNTKLDELEKWIDEQKITFEFACKLKAKIKTLK